MPRKPLARDELWDVATTQLGFVTAQQAADLDVGKGALQMLVQRGTLIRVAHGVYRFPQFPVGQYDSYMLAVLWTRAPEACLSHETALDAYEISDVNPNRIHVTVAKRRRLRRTGGDDYVIHERPGSRLAALLRTLKPKTKQPASAAVLNQWIAQAEGKLGQDAKGGRLGWLVASSVAIACVQRAIDADGRQLFLLKGGAAEPGNFVLR